MTKNLAALLLVSACLAPAQIAPDPLAGIDSQPALNLAYFEHAALTANPTLREANSLLAQSAAQARQAGLYPNPSIGYQGEQIRGGSYKGGEQGAFIQQTFVLGGKLGLRRNVYEQESRSQEIGVSEQRARLLADVRQQFYAALAAQQLITLRKNLLGLAADAVTTARQLANVGQADAPDVLASEVEAGQGRVEYQTAQRSYLQAFRSLAALAGAPDLPLARLAGDFEHPPQLDPAAILNQLVSENPSLKRAQQDVNRARAALQSQKRESIPDLQIHAGLQQNFEPLTGNPSSQVGVQGFATASIALPLFNRNQGNVAAAKAEVERAQAEVERIRLSLRQSAAPLLETYLAGQSQLSTYRDQMIPRAQKAYQLYLDRYQNMAAAYPQVLVSQRTLFQLQVAYLQALENVWTTATGLQNFLLSSGLSAPPLPGAVLTTVNSPFSAGSAP